MSRSPRAPPSRCASIAASRSTPNLIPLGSRIYIEAYRHTAGHGWFRAEDVGGAIIGRHVDVYRSPPAGPGIGAQSLASERIYVIPPGKRAGADAPGMRPPPESPPPPAPADPSGGAGTSSTASSTSSPSGGAAAPY